MRSLLITGLTAGLLVGCSSPSKTEINDCKESLATVQKVSSFSSGYDRAKAIASVEVSCAAVISTKSAFKKLALKELRLQFGSRVRITSAEFKYDSDAAFSNKISGEFRPKFVGADGNELKYFIYYVKKDSYRQVFVSY